ncbi:MAG: hypothetical protein O9295_04540 [Microcystis sp. LE18-22.4A]|nr:hypothetical protein [Microcystis sp. LE18-22.4A]
MGKTPHPTPHTPHPAPTKNFFSSPYLFSPLPHFPTSPLPHFPKKIKSARFPREHFPATFR